MENSLKIYLNVCIYTHCVYIYIHVYIHIYIYTHIHTNINTLIYTYVLCKYVYKKPSTSESWDNSKIIFIYGEIIDSN